MPNLKRNRRGIMNGFVISRLGNAGFARLQQIASAPLRLLTAQPASPWFPILFYAPIAMAAILCSVLAGSVAWTFLVLLVAGVFLWTLMEYVIHSIGFHWPTRSPRWLAVQASHGSHHDEPTDPMRIVAQLTTSLPVAMVTFAALSLA